MGDRMMTAEAIAEEFGVDVDCLSPAGVMNGRSVYRESDAVKQEYADD